MANLYSTEKRAAFDAFAIASNAWENCLCFADCGLSGRYTIAARGEAGTELRLLWDAREVAHNHWASFIGEVQP